MSSGYRSSSADTSVAASSTAAAVVVALLAQRAVVVLAEAALGGEVAGEIRDVGQLEVEVAQHAEVLLRVDGLAVQLARAHQVAQVEAGVARARGPEPAAHARPLEPRVHAGRVVASGLVLGLPQQ